MKEEKNKLYNIVAYAGSYKVEYTTDDEYKNIVDDCYKKNRRSIKTEKYYYGNISKEVDKTNGKMYAVIHKYKKLTEKSTLSSIDKYTNKYLENEIIELYKNNKLLDNPDEYIPDINICYLKTTAESRKGDKAVHYDCGIRYIEPIYKDEFEELKTTYKTSYELRKNNPSVMYVLMFANIKNIIKRKCKEKDKGFILDLVTACENDRNVSDYVEKIRVNVNRDGYGFCYDSATMYNDAISLVNDYLSRRDENTNKIIYKNNKRVIYERRTRDLYSFTKHAYGKTECNSPIKDNRKAIEVQYEQLSFFELLKNN